MLLGTPPPIPHNPMLDTNGDGRITRPWNVAAGRGQTAPPGFNAALDTEVRYRDLDHIPAPWMTQCRGASEQYPGFIVRVDRAAIRRRRARPKSKSAGPGLDPRGINIDRNGVVWTALAASMENGKFIRRFPSRSASPKSSGSRLRTCSSGGMKEEVFLATGESARARKGAVC